MGINRSGFYKWRKSTVNPSERKRKREADIRLFKEYHAKYPSHGYRWLRAKIELDAGVSYSDNYAQRVCAFAGIRSVSKHVRRYSGTNRLKVYPNLLLADMSITAPMQVVVSDMTAFWAAGKYWELTLYVDLYNNSIVSYAISDVKGDPKTYIRGLKAVIEAKKQFGGLKMILHSDQGAVYSSKAFNELLPAVDIERSMSRAGTPTDNATMEAINGWGKDDLYIDFSINDSEDVPASVGDYVRFFNEERPAFALGYLTPKQFTEKFCGEGSWIPAKRDDPDADGQNGKEDNKPKEENGDDR